MITRIMAHPSRGRAALALANHRELADLDPYVVFDPAPHDAPSPLRCFLATCQHAHTGMPLLVIQDDAIPCRGFAKAATAAYAAIGEDAILALYVGRVYRAVNGLRAACSQCRTLYEIGTREYTPCVAVILPGDVALGFVEWAERNAQPGYRHDDELLAIYARSIGVRVFTTIPSLADHDNQHASIAGHRSHGVRSAWCWPGAHDMSSAAWSL